MVVSADFAAETRLDYLLDVLEDLVALEHKACISWTFFCMMHVLCRLELYHAMNKFAAASPNINKGSRLLRVVIGPCYPTG